jgi:hypothetical protein
LLVGTTFDLADAARRTEAAGYVRAPFSLADIVAAVRRASSGR